MRSTKTVMAIGVSAAVGVALGAIGALVAGHAAGVVAATATCFGAIVGGLGSYARAEIGRGPETLRSEWDEAQQTQGASLRNVSGDRLGPAYAVSWGRTSRVWYLVALAGACAWATVLVVDTI